MVFNSSSDFDERSYLLLNVDAAAAVKRGQFPSGRHHWTRIGKQEGRWCRAPLEPFDEVSYLLRYPDVLHAVRGGSIHSGYQHWLQHGKAEGRFAIQEQWPLPNGYVEDRYLRHNPDVEAAVRNRHFVTGLEHWEKYGKHEYRPGAIFSGAARAETVDETLPFGVNYFGFHSAVRGLGDAARGYATALQSQQIPLTIHDVPLWGSPGSSVQPEAEAVPFRINFIHQNADMMPLWAARYGRPVSSRRYNVGLWVWELHAGYGSMYNAAHLLHEIWVPTRYVADAVRTIVNKPVFQIPYVVKPAASKRSLTRTDLGIALDAWVFLFVFDLSSGFTRKNPLAAIQAFSKSFTAKDKTVLVLKYSQPQLDPRGADLIEALSAQHPNILTISRSFSEEEMACLYEAVDCFVSPHRSEGFGLSIAHAMYYGKPAIATGYSGNVDFMDPKDSYFINYRMVEVGPGNEPYAANYVWADPDVEHLASLLRKTWFEQDNAITRGKLAGERIQRTYTPETVGSSIVERLRGAGLG